MVLAKTWPRIGRDLAAKGRPADLAAV